MNVTVVSFGMDQFSVCAPTGVDTEQLTEFLKTTNVCQREHIEYAHSYDAGVAGQTCYVFIERGSWEF